ncbi:conserved hypothetical protein [Uncinocarpus reesii 1704]|uniref:Protein kinase domain-containing protein n=1 Tax=Uncinocarpus reesii (strain UAMH 1704) TaxID=336963 RepID=C4JJM0_UNCRE|nr:uncharacterized protein UREG_01827 [Uncinocarpus reesii 1704]EEP76978.1 conserved hypothetical protein [Uncinocarpus reesii 1704]
MDAHHRAFRRNTVSRPQDHSSRRDEPSNYRAVKELPPPHPDYSYEEYNPFSSGSDLEEYSAENTAPQQRHYHCTTRPVQGPNSNLRQAYHDANREQGHIAQDFRFHAQERGLPSTTPEVEPYPQETDAVVDGQRHLLADAELGWSNSLEDITSQFDESGSSSPQGLGQDRNQYTPSLYSDDSEVQSQQINNFARNEQSCENTRYPRSHKTHSNSPSFSYLSRPIPSQEPPELRVGKLRSFNPASSKPRRSTQHSPEFPHPHHFQTLSSRERFDPLNFFPGATDSHGSLELPNRIPVIRRATEPAGELKPGNPQIIIEPSTSNRREVPQPCVAADTDRRESSSPFPTVPYTSTTSLERVPTSLGASRPRKKSIHRFAESFKKLFQSRNSPDSHDNSPKQPRKKSGSSKRRPSLPSRFFRRSPSHSQPPDVGFSSTLESPPVPKMDRSRFLDPSSAMMALTKQKSEAMRLAREQAGAVAEMCRRARTDIPPYTFEELIGKGSRQLSTQKLVAIKVMDIDKLDYKTVRDMKDESIKDFIHETKVLQQVKDAGAKNINMFIEAVSIHSQLWLICEYCPGGSVKTLMRATGDKLEEKFIIPIARELAEGLKAIHDAGIIHRDVKGEQTSVFLFNV